jgi:hypothetical protein
MAKTTWTDCEGNTRRDFLKLGTVGLAGLGLADLLRLEASASPESQAKATAKSVIMVWLAGGPATIDMWDPKPNAPKEIAGEFKAINTNVDGVQFSELLPQMAKLMDQCTVVRSLYHTIPSHSPGTVYMHTGHKPTPALKYPSLGSLSAKLLETPKGIPPYITFGRTRDEAATAGYLGPAYNPFEIEGRIDKGQVSVRGITLPGGFALADLENRQKLRDVFDASFDGLDRADDVVAGLDDFQQQALDMLRSDRTQKAFDLNGEPAKLRERYGNDTFGQGALVARRLVEAGVRFVSIGTGGWDTHGNNFKSLKDRLVPPVDRTLSALIEDLRDKGLLDSTIVYCVGEFGRTPKINKNAGRDHWARSMAVLLAGGGFKKGYVHGSTNAEGMAPDKDGCLPEDISATIVGCLGLDPKQELITPSSRPIALFRDGEPVTKLLV